MIKITIDEYKYNEKTDDFVKEPVSHFFNLTMGDIIKNFDNVEGLKKKLDNASKEIGNAKSLHSKLKAVANGFDAFNEILSVAYGVRKGDNFIKNEETKKEYLDSTLAVEIPMYLLGRGDEIIPIIKKMLPEEVANSGEFEKYQKQIGE